MKPKKISLEVSDQLAREMAIQMILAMQNCVEANGGGTTVALNEAAMSTLLGTVAVNMREQVPEESGFDPTEFIFEVAQRAYLATKLI